MSFDSFHGNADTVTRLRSMLAAGRLPHALILSGPQGAGKYLLALMLAKSMNCEAADMVAQAALRKAAAAAVPAEPEPMSLFAGMGEPSVTEEEPSPEAAAAEQFVSASAGGLPDFCGVCSSCEKIGLADDFDSRFAEAVEAREALKESEKKETRILLQPHPNVVIVPPDPPQLLIKVDQVRKVIEGVRFLPLRGRRVYVFVGSGFIKEAANSLLKILEEPPEYATLILLTENPGELLPTIRSRCVSLALAPLKVREVEADLVRSRPELNPAQRGLVARLARGAIGRARTFDIATYSAARSQALVLLRSVISDEHSELFKTTETFRAGADGRAKTDQLIAALYSLLEDLLFLQHGASQMVRNTDVQGELKRLAAATDFRWLERATEGLAEVQRGMRRNLLRSLSLDAFATALE